MHNELLYISNGNIPSRWAHTVQTMKMSEALAGLLPGFGLLIPGDLLRTSPRDAAIFDWYGITRPFPLLRLPMAWRLAPKELERSNWRLFASRARAYTWLRRPRLILTRCHESADYALRDGFRVIFETHDGPGHPKTMDAIRSFARMPNLAGVVTTSEVLKEAFCAEGLAPERVLAVPNAVDVQRFDSINHHRPAAREELRLRSHELLAIYTGSLKPYKGIATFIAAARLRPQYRFMTVGGTAEEVAHWRAEAVDCPNLRMLPFVPNAAIPRYLAAADACIVPNSAADRTAGWTFSLKLYEYLAAGRPVIASDIPSLHSALDGGRLGLLVPPDDAEALATALDQLAQGGELRERLGRAGRMRAAECTWAHRARRVVDAFAPELMRSDED